MGQLDGKIAWVTGAGSGIGEAAARALAAEGALVVLTGRRQEALEAVASAIASAGGRAVASAGDVTDKDAVAAIASRIAADHGRLDILVNNAGANIPDRAWSTLTVDGVDAVIDANLRSAFYCVLASLPMMRAGGGGVIIHTASWAGRHLAPVSGAVYSAAKHAVVAMSHLLNAEEAVHGIRSTALCPAEVSTPILDRRPTPTSAAARARMLQPSDLGDLIRYVATLPPHVCVNEILISPTWNRMFDAVRAADAAR